MSINWPGSHHTQKGNTMLRNIATGLGLMLLLILADLMGRNELSSWLAIPLFGIYITIMIRAIRDFKRGK
jgi:hypothetical protein